MSTLTFLPINSSTTMLNDTTTTPPSPDEETAQFLQMYQDLTSNGWGNDGSTDSGGTPIILSSLHRLEQALNHSVSARLEGMNVDTVTVREKDDNNNQFLHCHFGTLLDFDGGNSKHALEAAAGIALALHHLNEGIGWIVPEVTGLPQRCPIRFTTEFADTQATQGIALQHILDMTERSSRKPCAFIGATHSAVSIPTAIVTGIRGYVQVSPSSTSDQLDDPQQFPLFARTVPSNVDNAIPIVKYIRHHLNATHLAVLHVNNQYGNALADDLKVAAGLYTPDLELKEFELTPNPTNEWIQESVQQLKETQFTYIFVILEDQDVIDRVMMEAVQQNVAGYNGNGTHNWFFSSDLNLEGRTFEPNSPLHQAYQGSGRMQISGGHAGMSSFDTFACNLRTLRSSRPDLDFLASLLPPAIRAMAPDIPFLYDADFLEPVPKMADQTSPAYEAAIALGLSACQTVAQGLPLNGTNHYQQLLQTSFQGVVGSQVRFLNETGTRDPNTTLFSVENEQSALLSSSSTQDTMVQFQPVITDLYREGEWDYNLQEYIFSDGTSQIQPSLVPPAQVDHQYIHTPLKVIGGLMFAVILLLVGRFAYWTEKNIKTRVVRASQPLFLRVILFGVVVFSSAIVPLNIDDRVAPPSGCTIACNFFYWLMFLGFSIMFSGLFTKIYRVNQILNNPVKFRRVKVTVKDVIKPMAAIIGVNFTLLVIMTAVAPSEWEIVVAEVDQHGRPTETYGHCTTKQQIPYYATLGVINFAALLFSIQQAYNTRKLATEFSESRYIFFAMVGILVALFQGIPVLILVRDNPDVQDFIKCTVIFVTCCSVLLFMFVPKMKFLTKQMSKSKSLRLEETIHITGLQMDPVSDLHTSHSNHSINGGQQRGQSMSNLRRRMESNNNRQPKLAISGLSNLSGASTTSGGSSEEDGGRFSTLTHAELQEENKSLRENLKLLGCDLGTLATDDSVSEGSDGSSGLRIIARKSPSQLMIENKQLNKLLKKAIKQNAWINSKDTIAEEEKESESGGSVAEFAEDTNDSPPKSQEETPKTEHRVSWMKSPQVTKMYSDATDDEEQSTKSSTEPACVAETDVEKGINALVPANAEESNLQTALKEN